MSSNNNNNQEMEINSQYESVNRDLNNLNIRADGGDTKHQVADSTEDCSEDQARILKEYEKTMCSCIRQVDEWKTKVEQSALEKAEVIKERDQALEDLHNVENAFADLHGKYERIRAVVRNFQMNEEILKQRDARMQEKINNRDAKLAGLKEQVELTMFQLRKDYETRTNEVEVENGRLRASHRKLEMTIESLESDLEHKNKDIAKLNSLCDDFIAGKIK